MFPLGWDIVTGDETWAYQYDPETKQQSAMWVFLEENPPVKFKRNRSASKQMIACFSAKFDQAATIPLEDRKTVTADWYVNHCLPKVFQVWCKRRPRTGVPGLPLHHDNASAHAAAVILVGCLLACLTSQQQGRICSDDFTCCHTEIEVADQTFYLTQSQYTDTGPTSPSADPTSPGAWQGSHWSAHF